MLELGECALHMPSPVVVADSRDHHAIARAAKASIVPPMKSGLARRPLARKAPVLLRSRKARPAKTCKASPAARASQRSWRRPIQNTAAPSIAQTAEVHRASSASGTASVTKPRPRAAKHSASQRCTSPRPAPARAIHQPSARYNAPSASEEKAAAYSKSRTRAACRPKATIGVPKISVASMARLGDSA